MKVNHTTFRNEKLFCLNCGGEFKINYPVGVTELTQKVDSFNELHKDCKPTWKEPEVNQELSVHKKAMFWMANGEIGMSSKTMWNCLMGNESYPINHPYDPDDFRRCYNLLQTVPEWKSQLFKLKPLSKQWSKLVDNWEKLTEMYEQNVNENWKNYKKIGMYEFLQTLIG